MQPSTASTFRKEEDIFEIASQFPNAVVQQYAKDLQAAGVTRASFQRDSIKDELVASGIQPIPAGDIVDAFRRHFKPGPVGVFWDIENMGLPDDVTPIVAVTALREQLMANFGDILEFKAYIDLEMYAKQYVAYTRVMLSDSGLQIVDASHGGVRLNRKEVADKMIIVDALTFALTHEKPTVCIISGDSDFSPLLAKLKMRGIRTVVVTTADNVRSLREQATFALSWPFDFLPNLKSIKAAPQRNLGTNKNPSPHSLRIPPSTMDSTNGGGGGSSSSSPGSIIKSPRLSPQTGMPVTPITTNEDLHSIIREIEALKFADLKDCVKRVQAEVGARKVRRSKVGQYLKQLNPLASLKDLCADAEDRGIIKTGGYLANAWVALGTDSISEANDDDTDEPINTSPSDGSWYITLRFSTRFKVVFEELKNYSDPRVSFLKVVKENANWYRLAIGTFDTREKADRYFQRHFGHLSVLPKFSLEPLFHNY